GLAEQPGKRHGKKLVADKVGHSHGLFFQRVYQAHAVDEFALALSYRVEEMRQVLRGDRQIGVEDHEDIAGGVGKAFADGIAFAFAFLSEELDVAAGIARYGTFNRPIRIVARATFDENQFSSPSHFRN